MTFAFLSGCHASGQSGQGVDDPTVADSWEVPATSFASAEGCYLIEPPLVRAVNAVLRSESTATLAAAPIVKLTDEEAARLIGAEPLEDSALAASLMQSYLDEMRSRKHRAEVERRDSWSVADETEFDALSARYAAGSYRAYRPYLVRAVAKHEGTGAFYAELCGRDLRVVHGSLGRSTPPSTKVPLVIFLNEQPDRVLATWSIAE
jgi:hypothetical protein